MQFLIFTFKKWKNYKLLKSCFDLKDLSKSFKRNAKIMIQGTFYSKNWNIIVKMHQSTTLKTHIKKGIISISKVEHRWQPTNSITVEVIIFHAFRLKHKWIMISFTGFFHNTGKWFWDKNSFLTNFQLMLIKRSFLRKLIVWCWWSLFT